MSEAIIIGAGPAGLTAALYLARQEVKFLILTEHLGGELINLDTISNYPALGTIKGLELARKLKEQLSEYAVEIKEGVSVKKLEKKGDKFLVTAEKNGQILQFESQAVIIATGKKPKKLNVKGEDLFLARGLSYCSICDGHLFKNKKVAVIGSGRSAASAALNLQFLASEIFLLSKYPQLKVEELTRKQLAQSSKIKILAPVLTTEIFGDQLVKGLKYLDQKDNQIKSLEVDGVFVYIGFEPNSDFVAADLKNEKGEIKVNERGETEIKGLFAAGDVTNSPYKQIVIAAASGSIAALSAIEYLGKTSSTLG